MLANAPCTAAAQYPRIAVMVFVVGFFLVCILSTLVQQRSWQRTADETTNLMRVVRVVGKSAGIFLVGFAARRRSRIPRGLELFPKINAFVSGPSCRLAASSDLLAFGPCLGFDIVIMDSMFALTLSAPLSSLSPRSPVVRTQQARTAEPAEADRMAAAVMCPGTVWSEMRSIPRQERQFLLQLQALLKQLDPSARRRVITERLTQAQRLALERYMLTAQKCRAAAFGKTGLGRRSSKRPLEDAKL
eukprot:s9385_g2.t1